MNAENLTRVRLIDIDWRTTVKAYWTLMRLHEANGIDDDGHNTENGVLTGSVYFDGISPTKYKELTDTIKTVTFTYGQLLEEHTVTFKNWDGTTLNTQKVEHRSKNRTRIMCILSSNGTCRLKISHKIQR